MADDIKDTGFRKIVPQAEVLDVRTGKDLSAYGEVEPVTGMETRPCCMCRSYEDVDKNRLVRHIMAKGLTPREDGKFESPIAKDYNGARANMTLDPRGCGICRRDTIVVEALATCENWAPTRTISEFQQRMLKRK